MLFLKRISLLLFFTFISTGFLSAQDKPLSSSEIYHKLEKFGVLAKVMYIAAHPDDENTRMISYLSNDLKADTRYVSLTRGDGGQNLIGTEIRELLGVIRTQELLAARRLDGGSQRFSRANDFGYSKNAEETIDIWDDKKVLSDVVWNIRTFRPDVIITRFDHRTSGRTHGHHTASAMLAHDSWNIVNDKTAFPEQLKHTSTWQPKRQFFNTSWWFYGSREKFAKADKTNLMSIDVGSYYPYLGLSNNEIAAASRSMHKCQGMGSTPSRGSHLEYLELTHGEMPSDKKNIFEGINTSWSRLSGGNKIEALWISALKTYDFKNPSAVLKDLLQIKKSMQSLKGNNPLWIAEKEAELDQIIAACAALYVETASDDHTLTRESKADFTTEIVKRLPAEIKLKRIKIHTGDDTHTYFDTTLNVQLLENEKSIFTSECEILADAPYTAPYYLKKKGSLGMYHVDDQQMIGLPETPRHLTCTYTFDVYGEPFVVQKDVIYKYTDPERGEVYRPVEIVKDAYVSLPESVFIFANGETKKIAVKVKALKGNLEGTVSIPVSKGWSISPRQQKVAFAKAGEQTITFDVTAPKNQVTTTLSPELSIDGKKYNSTLTTIDYDHIPYQLVELPSEAKFVNLDINISNKKIAYIPGAGDLVPVSLRQIGFQVDEIDINDVTPEILKNYATVILGIRAYNKWSAIKQKQQHLLDYVKNGGTLVVQYNTNRRLKVDNIGPYPIRLSRKRVSVEQAPITMIAKEHPILTTPNKITQADFDDWVQERGLYFADEWDENYVPILSAHDPGEEPQQGGMLHAKYGKGNFVYTGYSWFRQLPAGVPGAYRIFANIVSLGHE